MTKADIILDCACVKPHVASRIIFFYLALVSFTIVVMANCRKSPIWDYFMVKEGVHYAKCNTYMSTINILSRKEHKDFQHKKLSTTFKK